jgi:hypothetical protein
MGETICLINSKTCPFNEGGYCWATREQLLEIFDDGICKHQGRY